MMPLELRIAVGAACLIFVIYTLVQVKQHRLMLKYSLVWMLLSVVIFLGALFPTPLYTLARSVGFMKTSNFIFTVGFFFVLLIAMSHARAISRASTKTRRLTQQIALLEKRIDELSGEKVVEQLGENESDTPEE